MKYLDLHLQENLIRQTSFLRKNTSQKPASFRVKENNKNDMTFCYFSCLGRYCFRPRLGQLCRPEQLLTLASLVPIIKVFDNFYQASDSLGGRYCMWWFFDTEFVHSIYFRDFIFLSVNFTHPVPKFIYPKYYKNSNRSCTFLFLGRLSHIL